MAFYRSLFVTLIFFAGIGSAFSQSGVQVSVAGGPQSTWMLNQADSDEGEALDYSPTYGSHYGIKVGFFFSDKVGLQTGFIRSSQGQEYDHTAFGSDFESERSLTYNKIPVLLRFRSQPDEPAYFNLMVGPQFSILSAFSSDIGGNANFNFWGEKSDYTGTTTDLVLGFGPGFSLTDKFKLDLQFRFDYSLTDAEDKDASRWNNPFFNDDRPATHNLTGALQLGLTYGFGG